MLNPAWCETFHCRSGRMPGCKPCTWATQGAMVRPLGPPKGAFCNNTRPGRKSPQGPLFQTAPRWGCPGHGRRQTQTICDRPLLQRKPAKRNPLAVKRWLPIHRGAGWAGFDTEPGCCLRVPSVRITKMKPGSPLMKRLSRTHQLVVECPSCALLFFKLFQQLGRPRRRGQMSTRNIRCAAAKQPLTKNKYRNIFSFAAPCSFKGSVLRQELQRTR
jgi:hypothetical protein